MTSNEIFNHLVKKRDLGGRALYERVTLAKTLLEDRDWVRSPEGGGGDENIAIDRLESECFGDTGFDLPKLFKILAAFPNEEDWKRRKYRLNKIYDDMMDLERERRSRSSSSGHGSSGSSGSSGPSGPSGPSGSYRSGVSGSSAGSAGPTREESVSSQLLALKEENTQLKRRLLETERRAEKAEKLVKKFKKMLSSFQST